jgi:hypothetical protein
MSDEFAGRQSGLSSPFRSGETVDVSSSNQVLASVARGFYVGASGGGFVDFETVEGNRLTIEAAGGSYHPWRVTRFFRSGTTATGIVAGH